MQVFIYHDACADVYLFPNHVIKINLMYSPKE